ncbi:AMP-binding protein [Actinomadura macra]|uniref:AMP-binding protein n=1 Tax=Actinomadura macra TaxID=46164 RepID=UPI0008338F41|nr:AMP-binding protein [Actinomadura macra]
MPGILTELFREQARRHGDRTALVDGPHVLSYAGLDAASDEVAAGLAARGVRGGDLIALRLPRSADLVIGALGILKCGAGYSPLDVGWPAARLDRIAARLGSPVTVDAATLPALRAQGARAAAAPRPVLDVEDVAVVLFTSGSTGEPKGVLYPHRGISRLIPHAGHIDFSTPPVIPLAAAVPWDAMSLEMWGALCTGGTLVVSRDRYLTPARLREFVTGHGVDSVVLATSLFNLHVEEDIEAFTGLRQVATGGEKQSSRHVFAFLERHPEIALINIYGPTENGVLTTTHLFTAADADADRIPIGTPVPGTSVHLVGGEIWAGGDGLAHGYLGDPEGTAERFTELTLDGRPVRAYRTGDRGHRTPDGLYHYAGRMDRQVKVRGHRIEPAEVEHAAERVDGVTRAAVVPVAAPDGPVTGLALFYTGDREAGEVLGELRSRLPGYLVPSAADRVERFPLMGNGKIDNAALRVAAADLAPVPTAAAPSAGAEGTVEQRIADVFTEVLGRDVPPEANFFALGGDSLGAGRLSGRLTAALGMNVPLAAVFRAPSIAGLVDWAERAAGPAQPGSAKPGPEAEGHRGAVRPDGAVPLPPSQLGFFAVAQMDPSDTTALCPLVWDFTGSIDERTMRAALEQVNARHEALRSRYTVLDVPMAVRLDEPHPVEMAVVGRGEDVLPALIAPLDPEGGRLWRAALGPGRFGVVVHHIAFDGASAAVLARDLSAAYRMLAAGRPVRFDRTAPSLADLAAARGPAVRDGDLAGQRDYWRTALREVPDLDLPAGAGPPGVLASLVRRVDERALAAALRSRGATATLAVLAAYAHGVGELTGIRDLTVGVPVARRPGGPEADAVSCMIEMLCVRLRRPTVDAARAAMVESLRHGDVPVHEVARLARRKRLYPAVVSVQDNPEPLLDLPGARTRHVWADTDRLDTDLLAELLPGGRLRVSRRGEAVSAAFAGALADLMAGFLNGIALAASPAGTDLEAAR